MNSCIHLTFIQQISHEAFPSIVAPLVCCWWYCHHSEEELRDLFTTITSYQLTERSNDETKKTSGVLMVLWKPCYRGKKAAMDTNLWSTLKVKRLYTAVAGMPPHLLQNGIFYEKHGRRAWWQWRTSLKFGDVTSGRNENLFTVQSKSCKC